MTGAEFALMGATMLVLSTAMYAVEYYWMRP